MGIQMAKAAERLVRNTGWLALNVFFCYRVPASNVGCVKNYKSIKHYFQDQINFIESPFLLGLSGGPDSMALFHLLKDEGVLFEVAHIDHGWRKESVDEASYLGRLCQEAGIRFHLGRLESVGENRNLEDQARKARLSFFREVCTAYQLTGVALAHHADDQAETVLKRFFEGATLPKLQGLVAKREVEGVTIYRPLLKLKKENLLSWINQRNLLYFEDATNRDSRFLRSRLRHDLIPALSEKFGKQVGTTLCRVGEAAAELGEFLETLLQPYRKRAEVGPGGIRLDLKIETPQTPFLYKAVIRDLFEQAGLVPSTSVVESVIWHLENRSCHTQLQVGTRKVLIHRQELKIQVDG